MPKNMPHEADDWYIAYEPQLDSLSGEKFTVLHHLLTQLRLEQVGTRNSPSFGQLVKLVYVRQCIVERKLRVCE